MRIQREEDVKTRDFYIYFGGAEDKYCEKPQIFGRTEGDCIMIMPPIKLKTILEPTIVFFLILLITIVHAIICICMASSVLYNCRESMIFMQEMKSCRGGLIKPAF